MDSGAEGKDVTVKANFNLALGAERMEHPQSFVAREGEATTSAECMVAAKQRQRIPSSLSFACE